MSPRSTLGSISLGFINMLEGAGAGGVRRVIFASSGGVLYGEAEVIPTAETAPKMPVSPYGVSKLAGEYYLRALGALRGFEGIAMRYANVSGRGRIPSRKRASCRSSSRGCSPGSRSRSTATAARPATTSS